MLNTTPKERAVAFLRRLLRDGERSPKEKAGLVGNNDGPALSKTRNATGTEQPATKKGT